MSVGEMARRMHKHRNNIPRWESRHGSPSLEVMDAYADILGNVSVEWLTFEIGNWPADAQEAGPDGPGPTQYAPRDSNPEPADYRPDADAVQLSILAPTPEPLHLFTLAA